MVNRFCVTGAIWSRGAANGVEQPAQVETSVQNGADAADRVARTRREFIGALATAVLSALLIGLLWLFSRRAPSAGRDPVLTPLTGP